MTTGRITGDGIPPRPDPGTGQPLPPPGATIRVTETEGERRSRIKRADKDLDAGSPPRAPRGHGPALGWQRVSVGNRVTTFAAFLGVMAVLFALERGLDWTLDPVAWLILLIISVPMILLVMDKAIAAGSDWLRRGHKWVRLYELKNINAARDDGDVKLTLTDVDERWVQIRAKRVQAIPTVWALTYNGMRHSTNAGAEVSGEAAGQLDLPRSANPSRSTGAEPRMGPMRWMLGIALLIASIVSVLVSFALGSQQRWFGEEGFDFALATGLLVLAQLMIGGIATFVGNVPLAGALGGIAFLVIGIGLVFGPVGLGISLFDSRATGVVVGMAVGMALIAAALWLLNNHARLIHVLRGHHAGTHSAPRAGHRNRAHR